MKCQNKRTNHTHTHTQNKIDTQTKAQINKPTEAINGITHRAQRTKCAVEWDIYLNKV